MLERSALHHGGLGPWDSLAEESLAQEEEIPQDSLALATEP